jgi:hypothetical protein
MHNPLSQAILTAFQQAEESLQFGTDCLGREEWQRLKAQAQRLVTLLEKAEEPETATFKPETCGAAIEIGSVPIHEPVECNT